MYKISRGSEIFPVSIASVTNERLVIYPHPLFGTMIPFNKDTALPSNTSAMLLNNPIYNIKLACSVVLVLDR